MPTLYYLKSLLPLKILDSADMKAGGLGDASQFSGDLVGEPEVFHCVMALYGQRGLPRQASDGAKESQIEYLWWNWDAWIWIRDQNWYAWI